MKFAVVGAGEIGQLRARTVRDEATTQLVGVADPNQDAARKAAGTSGARAESDYRPFLDDAQVEALMICTPVGLHEEMTLAALAAGKHVLVEKPLSNSVESCRRIHAEALRSGRTVAVGFNHRYYPAMKFVKSVVDGGGIGTVEMLRVFGGHDGLANFRADWMYQGELSGGGAMMDVGIHMTDLVRFLLGDVGEVYGVATGNIWKVPKSEDRALAIFKARSGVPAFYEATWNEWKGYQIFVEAYGDKGMVRGAYAPMMNLLITQDRPGAPKRRTTRRYPELILKEKILGWQSTTLQTFKEELSDFLRRIEGATVPLGDTQDGLRAVQIADAVYQSTRTGAAVPITP